MKNFGYCEYTSLEVKVVDVQGDKFSVKPTRAKFDEGDPAFIHLRLASKGTDWKWPSVSSASSEELLEETGTFFNCSKCGGKKTAKSQRCQDPCPGANGHQEEEITEEALGTEDIGQSGTQDDVGGEGLYIVCDGTNLMNAPNKKCWRLIDKGEFEEHDGKRLKVGKV